MEKFKIAYFLIKPYFNEMSKYVVDIGALNLDWANTKPFVNDGFNVMLVEPNPESTKILYEQTSKIDNALVVSVAIHKRNGTTKFLNAGCKGHSRIPNNKWKASFNTPTKEIEVDCWTISKLFEKYPEYINSDFIDIDVEGMDEVVLESLFETTCRPKFILIEHQDDVDRITIQNKLFENKNYFKFGKVGNSGLWKKTS